MDAMKILITHHYSFWNAGDTAITLVLIKQLKNLFAKATFSLSSMDYMRTKKEFTAAPVLSSFFYEGVYRYKSRISRSIGCIYVLSSTLFWSLFYRTFGLDISIILTSRLREFMYAYKDAHVVIAQGGGYFLSKKTTIESFITLVFHSWGVVIPKVLGKKVILHNQSIGPVAIYFHSFLLKQILLLADFIFVREKISYDFLLKLGIPITKIHVTTDAVFDYAELDEIQVADYLKHLGIHKKKPLIGVTVKNCLPEKEQRLFETQLSQAIVQLIKKGYQVICIPQCTSSMKNDDDREVLYRIKELLGILEGVYFVFDQKNAPFLRSLYKHCVFLLATRMHSAIFSLTAGVPVIALSYEPKHKGIMANLHLNQWVLPVENVSKKLLLTYINRLERKYKKYKKELIQEVQNQKIQVAREVRYLAKLIQVWYI